jgi:hypothetical protein
MVGGAGGFEGEHQVVWFCRHHRSGGLLGGELLLPEDSYEVEFRGGLGAGLGAEHQQAVAGAGAQDDVALHVQLSGVGVQEGLSFGLQDGDFSQSPQVGELAAGGLEFGDPARPMAACRPGG